MCANGACNNHGLKPFGTLPNMISNTVAVHDDDDVDDDVDEDDVEDVSEKQRKRKPATKIANQRRKIRRSPVRTTCCFVNADGYSCHKGKADVQARFRVPESEKNKFSENDRCCKSCYNRLQDAHFFRLKRVCVNCRLLGYERANTPGAWKLWQVGNDRFLLCSKCYDKSQAQRKRRKNGVPERRKGREAKGDW